MVLQSVCVLHINLLSTLVRYGATVHCMRVLHMNLFSTLMRYVTTMYYIYVCSRPGPFGTWLGGGRCICCPSYNSTCAGSMMLLVLLHVHTVLRSHTVEKTKRVTLYRVLAAAAASKGVNMLFPSYPSTHPVPVPTLRPITGQHNLLIRTVYG